MLLSGHEGIIKVYLVLGPKVYQDNVPASFHHHPEPLIPGWINVVVLFFIRVGPRFLNVAAELASHPSGQSVSSPVLLTFAHDPHQSRSPCCGLLLLSITCFRVPHGTSLGCNKWLPKSRLSSLFFSSVRPFF